MKIYRLTRVSLPKIAVLATGLAAAVMAFNMSPQAAQATPNMAQNCANCHNGSTSTATTATPSTSTPVVGATYTVAITLEANPTGGNSGYAIVPVSPDTQETNGGNTGPLLSYTATMTAPASAGTYTYTVYTNQGSQPTGQTGSAVYTITVAAASTTTATTPPTTAATTTTSPETATATSPPTTAATTTTSPETATATTSPETAIASAQPDTSSPFLAATALTAPNITSPNIHGPYTTNSGECATCHRTHTAKGSNLLTKSTPQSTLCFTCHDGTGANTNVLATYNDPAVPQNVVADRLIYRHDTLAPTSHTSASVNEFGGVSDRHSECSDCHNSHQAKGPDSTTLPDGVTASSRLAGVSGVSVVNGAAGTAPTYTFLPGGAVPITREYQLCFKCHSGFTKLDSNAGFKPSRYRLDKAIEFNPANPSYHPVEAPGKNPSPKMAASLAGPSPYKQWNFTTSSVISCANCHSNYKRFNLVTLPSANASSPLHASNTAGILRQPYRNRLLKPVSEAYKDSDFALCLMCHSNTPFANQTGTATNFGFHGYHLTALIGQGSANAMIDTPGAGGGNAICAECHFRQHSTTYKNTTPTQDISGAGLVSFAPNVQPNGGILQWASTTPGTGSCTLTCHGKTHTASGESYGPGSP